MDLLILYYLSYEALAVRSRSILMDLLILYHLSYEVPAVGSRSVLVGQMRVVK